MGLAGPTNILNGPAALAFLEYIGRYHGATRILDGHILTITLEWTLDIHGTGHATEHAPFDSLHESIRPTLDLAKQNFIYILYFTDLGAPQAPLY